MKKTWTFVCAMSLAALIGRLETTQAGEMPTAKHYTNSIGMKFVRIEPGSFTMGSESGEWDEKPCRPVNITRPFYMAVTEVTNVQYEKFDKQPKYMRGHHYLSKAFNDAVIYAN
jgi:formylglycine-generating enzyme required for sulfatase activity